MVDDAQLVATFLNWGLYGTLSIQLCKLLHLAPKEYSFISRSLLPRFPERQTMDQVPGLHRVLHRDGTDHIDNPRRVRDVRIWFR
jgi:hypothetical protein